MFNDEQLDVNDDMMNELDSCDPDEDDATMHEGLSRLFNVLEGEQCTSVHLAPRVIWQTACTIPLSLDINFTSELCLRC